MKIAILTIFPEMFQSLLSTSILGRARADGLLTVEPMDIRPFSTQKHRNTDDYPFGGGAGMVMTPQPIVDAVEAARASGYSGPCLYMSPRGKPLTQAKVRELAEQDGLILLCGHYEGVDQRALDLVVDEEISLGDFVLTGGELAAMAVVDAVARLVPGVLGSSESAEDESFSEGLLEYPQYTRPREYRALAVPEVLLNGDHAKINAWRRKQALLETLKRRPDLFGTAPMTAKERVQTLDAVRAEAEAKAEKEVAKSEVAAAETNSQVEATKAEPVVIETATTDVLSHKAEHANGKRQVEPKVGNAVAQTDTPKPKTSKAVTMRAKQEPVAVVEVQSVETEVAIADTQTDTPKPKTPKAGGKRAKQEPVAVAEVQSVEPEVGNAVAQTDTPKPKTPKAGGKRAKQEPVAVVEVQSVEPEVAIADTQTDTDTSKPKTPKAGGKRAKQEPVAVAEVQSVKTEVAIADTQTDRQKPKTPKAKARRSKEETAPAAEANVPESKTVIAITDTAKQAPRAAKARMKRAKPEIEP